MRPDRPPTRTADEAELAAIETFRAAVIHGTSERLVPASRARTTTRATRPDPANGEEREPASPEEIRPAGHEEPGPAAARAEARPGVPVPEPSMDRTSTGLGPAEPAAAMGGGHRPIRPADTAPDHLLRTPTSVNRAAEDFFGGLVRRVAGDR